MKLVKNILSVLAMGVLVTGCGEVFTGEFTTTKAQVTDCNGVTSGSDYRLSLTVDISGNNMNYRVTSLEPNAVQSNIDSLQRAAMFAEYSASIDGGNNQKFLKNDGGFENADRVYSTAGNMARDRSKVTNFILDILDGASTDNPCRFTITAQELLPIEE